MSKAAISLGMAQFKNVCKTFGPEVAIMVRGMQGIGKSQSVYQIASELRSEFYKSETNCKAVSVALKNDSGFRKAVKSFWQKNAENPEYKDWDKTVWHFEMGIPVVERRLSQLTEGDVTGLPFDNGKGGTIFKKTEWLLNACEFPCILFLDELNRAIKGVSQATFQLADSKAFDGACLHDETRVYVAANIGESFDVQSMDPAEISRYATVDLEPSVEDWLDWAKQNCDMNLVEFIRTNPALLEHKGEYEPNTKYPDRRAWGRLDEQLRNSGLYKNNGSPVFLHMAAMMVGFSCANSFWKFVQENALDISAEEILTSWNKAEKRMSGLKGDKRINKLIELSSKVSDYLEKNKITDKQLKELKAFSDAENMPGESVMKIYAASTNLIENHIKVAGALTEKILFLTNSKPTEEKAAETASAAETAAPVAKKRK